MSGRIQVVERAVDVLRTLSDEPATLTEVTRHTRLPKGTAFRILASLSYHDLVFKDPANNTYMLGPGFVRLMQGALTGLGAVATMAKPALIELWETTEETVALHVRMGAERVCIEELPSPQPIRYTASVGASAPLHVGSAGKVLLACLKPPEQRRLLEALPMRSITPATITDRDQLAEELELVSAQGWAASLGERIPAASAITVPVRARSGLVIALSILGPAERLTSERRQEFLPDLRRAATSIEAWVGTPTREDMLASDENAVPREALR